MKNFILKRSDLNRIIEEIISKAKFKLIIIFPAIKLIGKKANRTLRKLFFDKYIVIKLCYL